jgi:hypothetical protein
VDPDRDSVVRAVPVVADDDHDVALVMPVVADHHDLGVVRVVLDYENALLIGRHVVGPLWTPRSMLAMSLKTDPG